MSSSTDPKQACSEYSSNLEMLMQIPMFAGLPIEPLKVLTYLCRRESFKPEEVIFRQHDLDANAYYIIQGQARLVVENQEEMLIREFGAGDFVGGLSLLWDMKRVFTLKASSAMTCLMLSREKFQRTFEQFPTIGAKLLQNIAETIYQWDRHAFSEHVLQCPGCRSVLGISLI